MCLALEVVIVPIIYYLGLIVFPNDRLMIGLLFTVVSGIDAFIDFFVFNGVFIPRIHAMAFFRVSQKGPGLLNNIVCGEMLARLLKYMLVTALCVLAAVIKGKTEPLMIAIEYIILLLIMFSVLNFGILLIRRTALTMQVATLIIIAIIQVGMLVIFISAEMMYEMNEVIIDGTEEIVTAVVEKSYGPDIVFGIIGLLLAVISAALLAKNTKAAFRKGYEF